MRKSWLAHFREVENRICTSDDPKVQDRQVSHPRLPDNHSLQMCSEIAVGAMTTADETHAC